jgi:phospholipase C
LLSARGNAIGLGFRVPMLIASPWTRGGAVCSQVFDHTSIIQFLEKWLVARTGRVITEPNINSWRRAVCGDLTSAFSVGGTAQVPSALEHASYVRKIHVAQGKSLPKPGEKLGEAQLEQSKREGTWPGRPAQESGVRRACAIPYELTVDGNLSENRKEFLLRFAAGNALFKERAAGAAFIVYAREKEGMAVRHYTVAAGDAIEDRWSLEKFTEGRYDFRVHGPNGFYREFKGVATEPRIQVNCRPLADGGIHVNLLNDENEAVTLTLCDLTSGGPVKVVPLSPRSCHELTSKRAAEHTWHDLVVGLDQDQTMSFHRRYAGHSETGCDDITDPALGRASM